MSYFRQLDAEMKELLDLFNKQDKWLIIINADPDALASAMALKRIMARRVEKADIAQINEISRPDNLTMIKLCRIPTSMLTPEMIEEYDKFAIVDSQPSHNPMYEGIEFSIVLDHHPIKENSPVTAPFAEIKPEYGANATLLIEYLYNLKIEPSRLLATALLYAIKADTTSFERDFCDVDVKAFRYVSKFADSRIVKKIVRSEYHLEWLDYFRIGIESMVDFNGGCYVYMGHIENPDILVILADFFLKVHEISWTAVAGICEDKTIVIFRGDGLRKDVGKIATTLFDEIGSAGGHPCAARAEIPMEALKDTDISQFLCNALDDKNTGACQLTDIQEDS